MKPTLVVLAAGMGSRYGGIKQIDPVGGAGEAILDYSAFDAVRSGFGKIVFVIRKDIETDFREFIGDRISKRIDVDYAFQSLEDIPVTVPNAAERTKPWGTCHAVYSARHVVAEPFAVINADDFYGRDAYRYLGEFLANESLAEGQHAMVGYTLENTMSPYGSVSRGICKTDDKDFLVDVIEHTKIYHDKDSIISETVDSKINLTGQETVSMNMFGFTPGVFGDIEHEFSEFLKTSSDNPKAEFFIPLAVTSLISAGKAAMKVLRSNASWFGVTYKDDKPEVVRRIAELTDSGDYPSPVWS